LAGTKKKVKRKPTKVATDTGPSEYEGFKLEQKVWFSLWYDGRVGYGTIKKFYTECPEGPAASVWDEINHGYRSGLISTFSIDPPKGGARKLAASKSKQARALAKEKNK